MVTDDETGYVEVDVFSRVPILIEIFDGEKHFKELPNPDFGKDKPEKWNSKFGLLGWETLNYDEYLLDVKYNSSWDSLMPVINKINGLTGTSIYDFSELHRALLQVNIELAWQEVVKFFKWLNEK